MAEQQLEWIRQSSVFNTTDVDDIEPSIASDSLGNVYVTYYNDAMNQDVIVFKLDKDGNFLWLKNNLTFNTTNFNINPKIAVDNLNNVYIAYSTIGTVTGGVNSGNYDIVVFKMDSDGNVLWTLQEPSFNTILEESLPAIAVDVNGNAYITYVTSGTVANTNSGNKDIVVMKVSTSGTLLWTTQNALFNTTENDLYPRIVVDQMGNSYITYGTDGVISGGVNSWTAIVVFKIDTNGNVVWTRQQASFNTTDNNYAPTIAIDNTNNIYVTYQSDGVVSGGTPSGSYDIVVFKMDSDGNLLWIQQQPSFNTTLLDFAPVIAVDNNSNVIVAYNTNGVVNGGVLTGSTDIVLFKLDTNGVFQWIEQQAAFNTNSSANYPEINADASGNIYVTYSTRGTIGGGPIKYYPDVVVFKFGFPSTNKTFKQYAESYANCLAMPSGKTYTAFITILNSMCDLVKQRITLEKKLKKCMLTITDKNIYAENDTLQMSLCMNLSYDNLLANLSLALCLLECDDVGNVKTNTASTDILDKLFNSVDGWYLASPYTSCFTELYLFYNNKSCGVNNVIWYPTVTECMRNADCEIITI